MEDIFDEDIKRDGHYWLNLLRPLICFLIVVAIVFCNVIKAYAAFYEGWDGILYEDMGMTSEQASQYSYPDINTITSYASANQLAYDFNFTGSKNIYQGIANLTFSTIADPTTFYVAGGNNIDVSDLPVIVMWQSYGTHLVWHRVSSSGKVCIYNNYVVSNAPMTVYSIYNRNGFNDGFQLYQFCKATTIDTADENGLYKMDLNSFYIDALVNQNSFKLAFTDLYINLSTTSGDSGSTGLSDYHVNYDGNIDYNYLIEGGIITDPQAPPPGPDLGGQESIIRQNTYANLDAYIEGLNNNSLNCHLRFRLPEYVQTHPNNYRVEIVYVMNCSTTNDQIMSAQYTAMHSIPMTAITGYGHYQIPNDSYKDTISFTDLTDEGGNTFRNHLKAYWSHTTGAIPSYYQDGNVISYGGQSVNGGSNSFGGYSLADPAYEIDNLVLTAHICVANILNEQSGFYVTSYDLLEGNANIVQNEIGIREDSDGNKVFIPVNNGNGSGNYGTINQGGQGGSVTIYNNNGEELVVDVGALRNFKDVIETLKDELMLESNNSYLSIVKESYNILPEQITTILVIGVCTLLFCGFIKVVTRR